MAVNSTIKRKTASGYDEIHPKTSTTQVEGLATALANITIDALNDIADVNAPSPTGGYVLTWDSATSKWIAAAGGVSKTDLQNVYVYGKASAAITIGQAIQFAGAQGGHILIKPAVPSEINANPNYMIGIAETNLANNAFGYVIVSGRLNVNTSVWEAGDILYFASAGSTAGALTTTEPGDPNACIEMAAVTVDGVGNGELLVRTTILTRTIDEVKGLQAILDTIQSDTNTTYSISAVDSSNDAIIRLTGSNATTDDIKLVAGSNITLTPSGDNITISATDTNTTYTLGSFGITATAAELNYTDGVTSAIQTQLNGKQGTITGGASTITGSDLTASRALVSNSSGKVAVSAVTSTELGYLDGVTSAIQTQLNAKAALASPALTGTPTAPTANSGTNTTQIATTAFVANALNGVAGGLNFAGSISLSGGKNGDQLASAGLSGPGDYLIVTTAGDLVTGGTFVNIVVQAPGDEGDSTLPVTLEIGDWIVYVSGDAGAGTMTVAIINNTDTRFAPTTHNHSASQITSGELNTARMGSGTATAGLVLKSDGDGTASWQADNNTTYSLGSFGVTSTAAELNVLDGITATTAELNYTDGVTSNIQTQLNAKVSKSGDTMTGALQMPDGVAHPGNSTPTALAYGKLTGYGSFFINADTDGSTTEFLYLTAGYGQGAGASNEGLRIGHAESSLTWKGHRVFTDNYHPNADTLTTARTIALSGAVTGSASFNGGSNITIATTATADPVLTISGDGSGSATFTNLGNATLSLTVNNDSHEHTRLSENATITYGASYLQWNDTSGLGGTGLNGAAPANPTNEWWHHLIQNHGNGAGYYFDIASAFHSDSMYFRRNVAGNLQSWRQIYHDVYHPEADKWTTARTITLGGDLTGSVSLDGSANVTLSAQVVNNSHGHTWNDITNASVNDWNGLRHNTGNGYIDFGPANTSHAHIYTDRPNFYFNKDLLVLGNTVIHSGTIGSQSVNYATTAGRAYPLRVGGVDLNFNWSGQSGQPPWLWGGSDGSNMYVYNPSNFSVNYANSAGSAGSATSAGYATDYANYVLSRDNRTIAPSEDSAFRLRFGFTSWANNNTSPYADYLHLRSYSDGSGGSDNLVMFKKTGIGMRIWQQTYGSGTAYSSYVDVLDSSNFSTWAAPASHSHSYLPLSGGTLTGNLTISNTLPVITFTDTNNDNDFNISNTNGVFKISDTTTQTDRFSVASNGNTTVNGNLYVSGTDLEVQGEPVWTNGNLSFSLSGTTLSISTG